jgi:hypothetical protein
MFRFTASDNISIAYEQWGQENGGPPVFLCHGYGINVSSLPQTREAKALGPGFVKLRIPRDPRTIGNDKSACVK